jgi:2-polyprenyl-3-methyl-5-hydroxy-6-metoxy-1,4-benzoquinol methylase
MYQWNRIKVTDNSNEKLLLQERECPICGNYKSKTVLTLDNFQFFSDSDTKPKQVTIQEQICQHCDALFLNPCYSNEGFGILFEEAGQSYGGTAHRPMEQFEWISARIPLTSDSSILDVGCGSGGFLASIPLQLHKIGVDIDKQSIEEAKKKNSDITFICSPFETLEFEQNVDLITMFHVLEHLQKPLQTLQRLHTLSNKNTKLVIEVPILENGLTNDINGFFSTQHLTHFSRNSFKNILGLSGWEILDWYEQNDYNGCRVLAKKAEPIHQYHVDFTQKTLLYRYLENWYHSINNAEKKLNQINSKKCLIWGGGLHLEFIYQISSLFQKDIEFILVDKDTNKQNKTWRGIAILDPSIVPELINEDVTFVASSYRNQDIIREDLLKYGVDDQKIITLYDYIKVY